MPEKESKHQVLEGSQFIFITPESGKPLEVKLATSDSDSKELEEKVIPLEQPTVLSRNNCFMVIDGEAYTPINFSPYHLFTVVTDRKMYRAKDPVRVFAFSPKNPEAPVVLEITRNNQLLFKDILELDAHGSLQYTLEDLDEASYQVKINLNDEIAEAEFTVAEYTLSFLQMHLVSHSYENKQLSFTVRILRGDIPYSGDTEIDLYCGYCEVAVDKAALTAVDGVVSWSFNLSGHTGPFSLILRTPEGDSAMIPIPGTRDDIREKIKLAELGGIYEGSLLPSNTLDERVRGIYIGNTGSTTSPLIVESIIGESTRILIADELKHMVIAFYNPSTGETSEFERRDIKYGTKLNIGIPYPLTIITIGIMGKRCYEYYGVLFRPENVNLKIETPQRVKPGSEVDISVTAPRKGKLLLVIADSRLEREDPVNKMAEILYKNLKMNLSYLSSGEVTERIKSEIYAMRESLRSVGGVRGFPGTMQISEPVMDFGSSEFATRAGSIFDSEMELPETLMASPDVDYETTEGAVFFDSLTLAEIGMAKEKPYTTRLSFPQVLLAELLDFDKEMHRTIKIGDQIGSFTAFAFFMENDDFDSAKTTIETSQDVYVELDVPALMSPGDVIRAKAFAKCPDEANVVVRTSQDVVEETIKKQKTLEITLKSAGEVMAEIDSPQGKDVTSKTIMVPGIEAITVSDVRWLEPGETLEGERIIVYPGLSYFIKDSVDALVQYPFGCAEQTSAKMYGLALVYRAMQNNVLSNGNHKVKQLLYQGAERMKLFYKNGQFSLWEGGSPAPYVTTQVLRNLAPMKDMDFPGVKDMIGASVENLLKNKVQESMLLPYSPKFAGDMKTVRDASLFYRHGLEKEKAVKLIRDTANIENSTARWKDETCWAGETEATSYALQVMEREDPELFKKGFNFLSSRIQNGRLYSTSDTCAFLELLSQVQQAIGNPVAIVDGNKISLENTVIGKKVQAVDRVFVRSDRQEQVDMLFPRADFKGEIGLDRTSLVPGEKATLTITPHESTLAPLVRVYLPGNVASLVAGAGVQKLYLPVKKKNLILELYAIRRGQGKLRVMLHDMYNPDKVGVLPGVTIKVQ